MIWRRNDEGKKTGPGPIETFEKELGEAIAKAEQAGVLAIHIQRALQSRAQWQEYAASLRSRTLGGR
jgi:hypothetical protein